MTPISTTGAQDSQTKPTSCAIESGRRERHAWRRGGHEERHARGRENAEKIVPDGD